MVHLKNKKMKFIFKPIGILSSPYKSKSGIPIQGAFDSGSEGTAEVFEEYEPGLKDIEGFSHLILIYVFHRSEGYDLICRPYMEDNLHGIFAIRGPRRPNPIGLSVVRFRKKKGRILYLSEVDMLDGTPLLDIKPFAPKFDHRQDVRIGWMEKTLSDSNHTKISDDRF